MSYKKSLLVLLVLSVIGFVMTGNSVFFALSLTLGITSPFWLFLWPMAHTEGACIGEMSEFNKRQAKDLDQDIAEAKALIEIEIAVRNNGYINQTVH